jgi:membrane-associated phospholipid phosphatase
MFTTHFRFLIIMTQFGNPAFLVPLAMALMGALLWQHQRAAAVWFSAAVAADIMLTVVSKLLFYADGGNQELNILSPSGHASLAVTFYGCAAIILASKRHLLQRVVIIGGAVLVVVFISISRIALQMHTPEEVFFGTLVGGLCVAGFAAGAKRLDKLRLHLPVPVLFVAAIGTASLWVIGHRFNVEPLIGHWGIELRFALGIS